MEHDYGKSFEVRSIARIGGSPTTAGCKSA
jgi:hypothetical protein